MRVRWSAAMARVRQRRYAREFRIQTDGDTVIASAFQRAVREALRPRDAGAASPALVIELCNELFRVARGADQLQAQGRDSKELRSIRRALTNIGTALEEQQICWVDPTGQEYDEGRVDFEPIAEAAPVPGLQCRRISLCERPAVLIRGKLVQSARGLVERPA